MKPVVLTTKALNRALLARQLLLQRSTTTLPSALEKVGGLQTQYAPSAYIALWSRLAGFRREQLTRALFSRKAVQGTLMRSTIHIVSKADYPLLAAGLGPTRREWWLRTNRPQGLDGIDYQRAASILRAELADGPRPSDELIAALARAGVPKEAWAGAGVWVDLVRVPPSGTWERRRADLYGLADNWVGPADISESEGMAHLCRRYLGGFGPAALGDIASWAGVPVTTLKPIIEEMKLRRFRSEQGGELLDLPRAPLPSPDRKAPVRFLPTWDATLLVHARRTLILPEEYRPLVFHTKNPQSLPTFLVDGQVAGSWKHQAGKIVLDPFGPIARSVRRDLEEEAAALAIFHA